MQKGYLQ